MTSTEAQQAIMKAGVDAVRAQVRVAGNRFTGIDHEGSHLRRLVEIASMAASLKTLDLIPELTEDRK
jgi:hypothetical protein